MIIEERNGRLNTSQAPTWSDSGARVSSGVLLGNGDTATTSTIAHPSSHFTAITTSTAAKQFTKSHQSPATHQSATTRTTTTTRQSAAATTNTATTTDRTGKQLQTRRVRYGSPALD